MRLEGKTFDIAGKGVLEVIHTGGGVLAMQGNVKDDKGNNVLVIIGEEGYITINKKNPEHVEFDREYIDLETYNDEVIAEEYYWGHEYDLQLIIAQYDQDEGYMVSMKGLEVFDKDTIKALVSASDKFDKDIKELRGWNS